MVHRIAQLRRLAAPLTGSPAAYGIAMAALTVAFGLRYAVSLVLDYGLHDWLSPAPFLTFYPTIILTTFFLGSGPGALVGILGGASAWYFFLEPVHSFELHETKLIAVALYVCASAFDIVLVRLLALSLDFLEGEKTKSLAYAQEREVLFTELQHRISNHLQLLSTLLDSQRSHVRDENAKQAMTDASLRLAMVGKLHRKLHDPKRGEVDIGALLHELSGDVLATWGRPDVACVVDSAPLMLPADKGTSVALIVTELVSNALEHGLAGRSDGTIRLGLRLDAEGNACLTVADDGHGLPPGFDPTSTPSLGLRIVGTLARQLGGTFEMEGGEGTTCRVTFPQGAAAAEASASGAMSPQRSAA
jgi:two-component sensor histidine kinase